MLSTRTLLHQSSIVGAFLALSCSIALGDSRPPTASIPGPESPRILRPERSKTGGSTSGSSGGWWIGPSWVAGALAVVGGLSLASKRFLPNRETGPIQVVGRSSLSPKHSVALVRVGDRILIVGVGPQGPPSTLGEVTDPAELARLIPRRSAPDAPVVSTRPSPSMMVRSTGFDRRIGDDE